MKAMYRQGDVLLVRIHILTKGELRNSAEGHTVVVAEGEATGHRHRLQNAVLSDGHRIENGKFTPIPANGHRTQDRRFFLVSANAIITHDEHPSIDIESGLYEAIIQREYIPNAAPIRTID